MKRKPEAGNPQTSWSEATGTILAEFEVEAKSLSRPARSSMVLELHPMKKPRPTRAARKKKKKT